MSSLMNFTPCKLPNKQALSCREKVVVLNVFNGLKHLHPKSSVDDLVEMCHKMTGYGKSTIYRVKREERSGEVKAPKSAPGRPQMLVDEDSKRLIRRTLHSFFFKREIPTLDKMLHELPEDCMTLKRTKLWTILKELGICWDKRIKTSPLRESDEIICWRRSYLRDIKKFRQEGRAIFYLDETWVNQGYTVGKVWQDKSVVNPRQAFLEGLSTGLKAPAGKGKRLIVTHIGSTSGFVDGGLLLFESKKTGDYHEDMNADVFEEYFVQMLDLIPPGSVIVMDNASYHSRQVDKSPVISWRKAEILNWLIRKNIPYKEDMVKSELISIVKTCNFRKRYAVDEMAQNRQITVLRLPPYHCELNPIELIWAQVKGYVARENKTFKLKDVKILLEESIRRTTSENWQKVINHVIKEEEKFWELDFMIDNAVEPLIITAQDINEESSSDDSEY